MLDLPQLKKDRILNAKQKIPSAVPAELLRAKLDGAEWPSHSDKRINARYESLEVKLLDSVKAAEIRKPSRRGSRVTDETKALMKRLQMLKQNGEGLEECRNLSRQARTRLVADCYYTSLFESEVHVPKTGPVADEAEIPLPEVTATEIEAVPKKLKNMKAPGPDGIPAEMLKAAGIRLWQKIAKFFTKCLRAKQIPLEWKESRTVLLFKKGDPEDLKNYRSICLLPAMYKLFTKVILNRITDQLDAAQPNEQAGFRSGYCTLDHMQVMNQLQEKGSREEHEAVPRLH